MAEVIICDPDLMFSSRIEAAVAKAGLQAKVTSSLEELLMEVREGMPRMIFLNLDAAEGKLASLERAIRAGCEFVGYYSHVNTGLAEEAKRLRLRRVISRGAFVTRLGELLSELSSGR